VAGRAARSRVAMAKNRPSNPSRRFDGRWRHTVAARADAANDATSARERLARLMARQLRDEPVGGNRNPATGGDRKQAAKAEPDPPGNANGKATESDGGDHGDQ